MMPLKIYVDPELSYYHEIRYVFGILALNKKIDVDFVNDVHADIKIDGSSGSDFIVSKIFYEKIAQGKTGFENHFKEDCIIRDDEGRKDFLSTIYYCINSIQEYNASTDDELGRFQFKNSYQFKFGNAEENLVQHCIDAICRHEKLKAFVKPARRSKIFLTHDIDSIHGAWKEDGFHALKKFQPGKFLTLILNEALGKPDWLNMDKVRKIEDEKGFRSTFYWLLYKDKKNSDYHFKNKDVQEQFKLSGSNGWENGLHKSLRPTSFLQEIDRLGFQVKGNRYHYLDFKLPSGYADIEESGIVLDTTLGFYENHGFRNSYGQPFMPYNAKDKRVFNLVEVPMHIMDRTFFTKRMSVHDAKKTLIDWFEKNKNDCVFTLNFHNNFFSEMKYAGYADLYKSLLEYFRESGFEPTTQSELINEFYKPEKFSTH